MEVHGIYGVMAIIIIGYVHTIMEVLADIIMTFLILGVGGVMVIIIHFIIAIIIITTIHTSKINGIIAYADSTVSTLKSISGLRRIRVAAVKGTPPYKSEDRMVVTAGYDSKEAADAATEQTASIWSGMAEFLADDPDRTVLAGDLIYAYNR